MADTTTQAGVPLAEDDTAATAALTVYFAAQRAAFVADCASSLTERRSRIEALMGMMAANRGRISEALASDFGAHPVPASDLIEVLGALGRATYVLAHLEKWMRPSPRDTDPGLHGTARTYVELQPNGGGRQHRAIELPVRPLGWTDGRDAGGEQPGHRQAFGIHARLRGAARGDVGGRLQPRLVHVATGSLALSRAFSALPWDHLLYTGSPEMGRLVMAQAALSLSPVTLELGGKCPALLTPGAVTPRNVASDRDQARQWRPDVRLGRLLPGAARSWRASSIARRASWHRRRRTMRAGRIAPVLSRSATATDWKACCRRPATGRTGW